jgi:very-short-patch-repair endonuclease
MHYDRKGKSRNKGLAKKLRKRPSPVEHQLYTILRRERQAKILKRWPIGRTIPPIALPFRNLVLLIEEEENSYGKQRRERREIWLKNRGFSVLCIPAHDILENPQRVVAAVENFPEVEENRDKFFVFRRAATKQSYWVDEPDSAETDNDRSTGAGPEECSGSRGT